MVKGLIMFCDENPAIVGLVIAFQNALTDLKAKVSEINETVEQVSSNLTGITADKAYLKQSLCELAADITGMIYAYAAENSNNTLKQEVNFSLSKLQRMRDGEIAPTCQIIHNRGVEFKTELDDYGVNPTLLTALQTAIDDYTSAIPRTRNAIGKRKTRREILNQLFKEMDKILNERMDNLMGKFRTSNPEFYETYFNLREVTDASTTTTQLKGIITDKSDDKPIKGVTIAIVTTGETAVTDSKGEYSFKPIIKGRHTVRINKDGYQPYENDELEVKMGDINHLDVSLTGV